MTNLKTTIFSMLVLAVTTITHAQEDGKTLAPPGSAPKDFTLPVKEVFGLDNGLKATLVPFGVIPKAQINVIIRAGGLDEGENTWLADLSADFFLEGTTEHSGEEIARAAAAIGGKINVSVGGSDDS